MEYIVFSIVPYSEGEDYITEYRLGRGDLERDLNEKGLNGYKFVACSHYHGRIYKVVMGKQPGDNNIYEYKIYYPPYDNQAATDEMNQFSSQGFRVVYHLNDTTYFYLFLEKTTQMT